jgi:dCTP deaminase
MILADHEIQAAIESGLLLIEPRPDASVFSSTALDLTLDGVILRWNDPRPLPSGQLYKLRPAGEGFDLKAIMDDPGATTKVPISASGFDLEPRMFVLGFTQERIYLPNRSRLAARVEGKSSLARLGVGVHVTAPTIHAGFGYNPNDPHNPGLPVQLEIFNVGNQTIVLDVGMPICQLILEEVREISTKGYQGRFSDQRGFSALAL